MNDRLPGSCWDNPIWYKGYRIYLYDLYECSGFQFTYCHNNYDGEGDNRHGYTHTVEKAKAEIDDLE